MKRIIASVITATVIILGLTSLTPASAHHKGYYGDTARSVAKHIGCKDFRVNRDKGDFAMSAGICYLKGKRVNVLTFRGPGRQADWNYYGKLYLPSDYFWASGKGAAVVAKNGNRPAARAGARALPGTVKHGL